MADRPAITDIALMSHAAGWSAEMILGPVRWSEVVIARKAMNVVMRERGLSYPSIARRMNRDHSSIMQSVRSGRSLLEKDEHFKALVERLRAA